MHHGIVAAIIASKGICTITLRLKVKGIESKEEEWGGADALQTRLWHILW